MEPHDQRLLVMSSKKKLLNPSTPRPNMLPPPRSETNKWEAYKKGKEGLGITRQPKKKRSGTYAVNHDRISTSP